MPLAGMFTMHCQPEAPRLSPARRTRSRARFVRLIAFVFFVAGGTAAAGADGTLDAVVVTATREPEAVGRSSADIVVIDAATIRNTTADSVEDLIRRVAGMQVVRNGGPGQNSGFFIRGASTNSTVVLVDGVRVGSATLGQAEFEALGLAQIERIEVLRGPASSLYGADAVGGVVQIFTRRGAGVPRWYGGAEIGGYHSGRGDVGASGSTAAWDYALSLGHERSRGVSAIAPGDVFGNFNPDRDGFRRNSATVQVGFAPAPGHRIGARVLETQLNSQYDASEFLPPTFAADPSADFRNRLTTRVASIDYRGAPTPFWTMTVQGSRAVDDLTSGGTVQSRFVTRREQATWQNALAVARDQRLLLAYEHLVETASADVFASELKRRNDAVVLGYSGTFDVKTLQADIRRDDNSAYGANTTGRLGGSLEVVRGVKLRALAGTTFRAPTFNDLAFPGFGVPTIRPERGRSVEAGLSWQGGDASASATVYRNHVRDLIVFQPDRAFCPPEPAYDFGCAANVGSARLQGATIAAAGRWRGFDLRASVDFLDAVDADTGVRLPRRAAHQESAALDYEAGTWRAGAAVLFVGSRPDNGVVLGGYGLVDLRVAWRPRPTWRVEAKLNNALDRQVEPLRDYRGLGRQAWLGVRHDSAGL
jgi:vitamin B12 transporter